MKRSLVAVSGLLLVSLALAVFAASGEGATSAARERQSSVKAIAASRERAAVRQAKKLLRNFVPPPGARRIPKPAGYGGVLLSDGPWPAAEVVDVHRFWSVHKSFNAVVAFINKHRPRGFKTEREDGGAKYHELEWSFESPVTGPTRLMLSGAIVPLHGRTVLRVDAKAVWIYPRSPLERVPATVREITLDVPKMPHLPGVHSTVTSRGKVERIVRWFNALPVSPPGPSPMCGPGPNPYIALSFRSASGRTLARAVLPPIPAWICVPIEFTLGGHSQAPLADRDLTNAKASFVGRLQRLVGVHLLQTP